MNIIIDNVDFWDDFKAEKYWSPTKNANIKDIVKNAVWSGDYCLSEKIDGDWRMIIKDMNGNLHMRGRSPSVNGGYADKIDWVPHLHGELSKLPNGTVLLGEMYLPSKPGSRNVTTILGCLVDKAVARQEKGEKLTYYIFDCLAYDGKNLLDEELQYRIGTMNRIYNNHLSSPHIRVSQYVDEPQGMEDYIGEILEAGGEGVVLKRLDGKYEPGKRTARKSIKVKKEIGTEIDAFLTGQYMPATVEYEGKLVSEWSYWLNLKTNEKMFGNHFIEFNAGAPYTPITKGCFYNWAGSVQFGVYRNGEIVPIGWISNVTEEVKNGIVNEPEKWCKKVAKISAMQIEEDTKHLRHAKVMEWRNDGDKRWDECDGKEIFG